MGGGDGLALREILKYPDVEAATLVELDPAMIDLARHDPRLSVLNAHSFAGRRVTVRNEDAFAWLRSVRDRYDAIIVNMPDPDETATANLYSVGVLRVADACAGRRRPDRGAGGSPYFAQKEYWCVEASIRAAGFATRPYHVDVPPFGDRGFVLAAPGADPPTMRLAAPSPIRSLDGPRWPPPRVFRSMGAGSTYAVDAAEAADP